MRNYPVDKAILFGSYAKGTATSRSDIDIHIDTKGNLKGLDFLGLIETLFDTLGTNKNLIDKSHIEPNSLIMHDIEDGGLIIYEKQPTIR